MATMQVDKEQARSDSNGDRQECTSCTEDDDEGGRTGLPPAGLESTVPARSERQQRSTTTDAMQDHKNKQEATATATDRNARPRERGQSTEACPFQKDKYGLKYP